jgi:hypothetical protein
LLYRYDEDNAPDVPGGKDYVHLTDMTNVHLRTFSSNPDPIESMQEFVAAFPLIMRSAYSEVVRRQNLQEEHKVSKVSDIRPEYRPPHVLLIVEEFGDASSQIKAREGTKAQNDMFEMVKSIVRVGRSSNFHLFLINQSPVGDIPQPLMKEMRKATFGLVNSNDSYWATGVKGAGAELLYRYDEDNAPDVPGELLYIAANNTHVIRPAITSSRMIGIAAKFYSDVKDAGEPTWLYGWKTPLQHEDSFVDPQATRKMTIPEPAPTGIAAVGGRLHSREGVNFLTAPKPKEMTAKQAFAAAGWLYDNHKAWSDYRERQAFSKLHTQGVFVLLNSKAMTKTAIMHLVFNGKNGRYSEFVNLCEQYLTVLQKRVMEKAKESQQEVR